jgi:hypothetical protein
VFYLFQVFVSNGGKRIGGFRVLGFRVLLCVVQFDYYM